MRTILFISNSDYNSLDWTVKITHSSGKVLWQGNIYKWRGPVASQKVSHLKNGNSLHLWFLLVPPPCLYAGAWGAMKTYCRIVTSNVSFVIPAVRINAMSAKKNKYGSIRSQAHTYRLEYIHWICSFRLTRYNRTRQSSDSTPSQAA